jgi:starch synthase
MPGTQVPVYVIDAPYLYRAAATPTRTSHGEPNGPTTCSASPCWAGWRRTWPQGDADPDWAPEVVHAHDWHAAMACAYVADTRPRAGGLGLHGAQPGLPGSVPDARLVLLGWPRADVAAGLEFHGQLAS